MKITFTSSMELKGKAVTKGVWDLHVSGDPDDEILFEIDALIDAIAEKLRPSSVK